jgi:hypothetical protein
LSCNTQPDRVPHGFGVEQLVYLRVSEGGVATKIKSLHSAPVVGNHRLQYRAPAIALCTFPGLRAHRYRLVRHALNRGNVLEGPLTGRIADAGNPGCLGQVATRLGRWGCGRVMAG